MIRTRSRSESFSYRCFHDCLKTAHCAQDKARLLCDVSSRNGNRNRQFIQRLFRRSSSEALPTQQNQTMIKKDGLQTAAEERQRQSKEFRTEAARQSIPKRWNNGKLITDINTERISLKS